MRKVPFKRYNNTGIYDPIMDDDYFAEMNKLRLQQIKHDEKLYTARVDVGKKNKSSYAVVDPRWKKESEITHQIIKNEQLIGAMKEKFNYTW